MSATRFPAAAVLVSMVASLAVSSAANANMRREVPELRGVGAYWVRVGDYEAGLRNTIIRHIRRELPNLVRLRDGDPPPADPGSAVLLRMVRGDTYDHGEVVQLSGDQVRILTKIDLRLRDTRGAAEFAAEFVRLYRKQNPDWKNASPLAVPPFPDEGAPAHIVSAAGLKPVFGEEEEVLSAKTYLLIGFNDLLAKELEEILADRFPALTKARPSDFLSSATLYIGFRTLDDGVTHVVEAFRIVGDQKRVLTTVRRPVSAPRRPAAIALIQEFEEIRQLWADNSLR